MTAEETVAYLGHTNLKTLVVEGRTDKFLMRKLEELLSADAIDVLDLGGKDVLDAVYLRRSEFQSRSVAFVRDRDLWVVFPTPAGYEDVIFTTGYSIENDVLDREALVQLAGDGSTKLDADVRALAKWFMHVVTAHHRNSAIEISTDVSEICIDGELTELALEAVDQHPIDEADRELFSGDPWVWLRGATLLRCCQRYFSQQEPPYTKRQLLDVCLRLGGNQSLTRLLESIRTRFGGNDPRQIELPMEA